MTLMARRRKMGLGRGQRRRRAGGGAGAGIPTRHPVGHPPSTPSLSYSRGHPWHEGSGACPSSPPPASPPPAMKLFGSHPRQDHSRSQFLPLPWAKAGAREERARASFTVALGRGASQGRREGANPAGATGGGGGGRRASTGRGGGRGGGHPRPRLLLLLLLLQRERTTV